MDIIFGLKVKGCKFIFHNGNITAMPLTSTLQLRLLQVYAACSRCTFKKALFMAFVLTKSPKVLVLKILFLYVQSFRLICLKIEGCAVIHSITLNITVDSTSVCSVSSVYIMCHFVCPFCQNYVIICIKCLLVVYCNV